MNRQELLKSAKPILFNTEMVKAIFEGRKTQTRQIIKGAENAVSVDLRKKRRWFYFDNGNYPFLTVSKYQKDDILYVRETYGKSDGITDNDMPPAYKGDEMSDISYKFLKFCDEKVGCKSKWQYAFWGLWDKLHANHKKYPNNGGDFSWYSNPFVWVYEFERVKIDD